MVASEAQLIVKYFGRAVSAASRTAGQHSSAGHAAGVAGAMQRLSHGSTGAQHTHDPVASPELEFLQMLRASDRASASRGLEPKSSSVARHSETSTQQYRHQETSKPQHMRM